MKTFKIYLVRCGVTDMNLQGRFLGLKDEPLCDRGIKELKALKKAYAYPAADAVFVSPLIRCKATAALLYPGAPTVEIPDFREYDFGEYEGQTVEQLKGNEEFVNWLNSAGDVAPPFGESNNHFSARVAASFEKVVDGIIKTGTAKSVIVAHGGVIMTILALYGLPEAPMHEWVCNSGEGYVLNLDAAMWMRGRKIEVFDTFPQSIRTMPNGDR